MAPARRCSTRGRVELRAGRPRSPLLTASFDLRPEAESVLSFCLQPSRDTGHLRSMWHGLILCCPTLLLLSASVRAKSLTFYVATNGNDHWSGRLEEPARDGKDGPLASLPAALEKTRAARQDSAKTPDGISILLRGGTYSVAQPVVLVPEDSGSDADHPFTIAAFPKTPAPAPTTAPPPRCSSSAKRSKPACSVANQVWPPPTFSRAI